MCNARPIWNVEDIPAAVAVLKAARQHSDFPGAMDNREQAYFAAAVAFTGGDNPPMTLAATSATRPRRYAAFLAAVSAIAAAHPTDQTARSFMVLGNLAAGSVGDCALDPTLAPCRAAQQRARDLAASAYASDPSFAGTLHYGMHAHDFANATVVAGGLPYAREYPKRVVSATHSLHMPSHIYQRLGFWRKAASANAASVHAADTFSRSGALLHSGGQIKAAGGFGHSYNAANLYHSLEFEHYERLQGCQLGPARKRLARMGYAVEQASRVPRVWDDAAATPISSLDPSRFVSSVGGGWLNATAYAQWEYGMSSRQALWSMLTEMLGAAEADATFDWRTLPTRRLPLPLAYQGASVTSHSFFSPLAEAALHNAYALASLYELVERQLRSSPGGGQGPVLRPLPAETREGLIEGACSSEDGCLAERVALSLSVIGRALQHYDDVSQRHEAACVRALMLQVQSLVALANGNTSAAMRLVSEAAAIEDGATALLLPPSVTLLFLPSAALEGALRLLLLGRNTTGHAPQAARAAVAAFERCLAPSAFPRMPLCLLGRARALVHAGDKEGASASYTQLLRESEWEEDEAECGRGLEEARVYTSASPSQGLLAFAASEQAEPQGERGSNARIVRMGYLASSYYPDGSTAAWGHDMRLAVELAVQEFNEAVSHTPVQMELVCVVETNGSVAGLNATLARMVDAGVDAVLGADWSRVAVAAAAYLAPYRIPLLSAGSTTSALDQSPNVFRSVYSDSRAAALLLEVVRERIVYGGATDKRIGILGSQDAFGLSGVDVVKASARRAGIDVSAVAAFPSTDPTTGELIGDGCAVNASNILIVQQAVESVRASGVRTLVVSATGPSTQCIFAAAAALGMTSDASYTWLATEEVHPTGGWTSPWGRRVATAAVGYVTYLGRPYEGSPAMRHFEHRFREEHGHAPSSASWAGYSFDLVGLVYEAARAGASADADRSLITMLRTIEYDGITGPISFPAGSSSPPTARIGMLQLNQTGTFTTVGVTDGVTGELDLFLAPFCIPSPGSGLGPFLAAILIGAAVGGAAVAIVTRQSSRQRVPPPIEECCYARI